MKKSIALLLADEYGLYIYERQYGDKKITVLLNARDTTASTGKHPYGEPLLSYDVQEDTVGPFGYAIWKETMHRK